MYVCMNKKQFFIDMAREKQNKKTTKNPNVTSLVLLAVVMNLSKEEI